MPKDQFNTTMKLKLLELESFTILETLMLLFQQQEQDNGFMSKDGQSQLIGLHITSKKESK
jgi:hypothetical protein